MIHAHTVADTFMSGLYFSYLNNSIIDMVKAKPLAKKDLEHLMYIYCEMKGVRHYAWPSTVYLTCVPGPTLLLHCCHAVVTLLLNCSVSLTAKTRSMTSPCREWPTVPAFPAVKGGGHEVYLPAMGLRANMRTLWAFGVTLGTHTHIHTHAHIHTHTHTRIGHMDQAPYTGDFDSRYLRFYKQTNTHAYAHTHTH
jgi:hypothetical protein